QGAGGAPDAEGTLGAERAAREPARGPSGARFLTGQGAEPSPPRGGSGLVALGSLSSPRQPPAPVPGRGAPRYDRDGEGSAAPGRVARRGDPGARPRAVMDSRAWRGAVRALERIGWSPRDAPSACGASVRATRVEADTRAGLEQALAQAAANAPRP